MTELQTERRAIHAELLKETEELITLYEGRLPNNSAKWHAKQHLKDALKWARMCLERE